MFGIRIIQVGNTQAPFIVAEPIVRKQGLCHLVSQRGTMKIGGIIGIAMVRRRLELAKEWLAMTDPGAPCGVSDGRQSNVEGWEEFLIDLGGAV